jgi:ABC-type transport system substrate-binding protein
MGGTSSNRRIGGYTSDIEAFFEEDSAFVADAGYCSWLSFHKDSFGNQSFWYNDEVSAKIDATMSMPAGPERTKLLWEIQETVIDSGGRPAILWPGWHIGANKHLKGFKWYYDNYPRWRDLYWE